MEIEELFCKRYPEYSVNGKPLQPYFDVFEEGYEQAEKENAELKKEIDKKQHLADVRLEQELETYQKLHIKSKEKLDTEIALDEVKEQLTKATELINLFIQWNYGCCDIPDYKDIVKQAEQFIKEIDKCQKKN